MTQRALQKLSNESSLIQFKHISSQLPELIDDDFILNSSRHARPPLPYRLCYMYITRTDILTSFQYKFSTIHQLFSVHWPENICSKVFGYLPIKICVIVHARSLK